MARVLSVYLPWWPIEYRRRRGAAREQHRPVLLVRTVAQRQLIEHACPRAIAAGVRVGLTLAQAKALLPDATRDAEACVFEDDPVADRRALTRLARWANRFTPLAAPDGTDGLWLDVTGCARVFHGERRLARRLGHALRGLGLDARLAIAPTHGAAWALARYGAQATTIIEHATELGDALSPLPVAGLRLDDATILALSELGVRRIGEVVALPRAQLPCRFSADLLLRLDQALGRALDPIDPVRQQRDYVVDWPFAGPVTDAETIGLATQQLLDDLARQLLAGECGVRRLRLTLDRYDATPVRLDLRLSRPSRDVKHLWRLLSPKLERANLGHGVEGLELRAIDATRIAHRQRRHELIGAGPTVEANDDEERARLLDALVHRLGRGQVLRAQPMQSHQPERLARRVSVDTATPSLLEHRPKSHRPTTLLERPEPIDVQALSPDGPVLQIRWRNELHRVMRSEGPERITSEWWREGGGGTRDYFIVRIEDGRQVWLYRDGALKRWFLHGVWA